MGGPPTGRATASGSSFKDRAIDEPGFVDRPAIARELRATEARPVSELEFTDSQRKFSPDGRRVAYVSNESGRDEVYVQAFPLTDEEDQISIGGGSDPEWRKDGAELFYLAADRNLMAVPVRVTGNAFATCSESTVSSPRRPGLLSRTSPWMADFSSRDLWMPARQRR